MAYKKLITTIPRGFVKHPKALDTIFALGLERGDELVFGESQETNPHYFYVVIRLLSRASVDDTVWWKYEVLRAPNWVKSANYAVTGTTCVRRHRVIAWRRPKKEKT